LSKKEAQISVQLSTTQLLQSPLNQFSLQENPVSFPAQVS